MVDGYFALNPEFAKAFHDAFLSYGGPPVRRAMMGEDTPRTVF
jgi:hypothetical protein